MSEEFDELKRYSDITKVIRKVAGLVNVIGEHLPWYIQKTRELTVATEAKTGISGDQIELIAQKLSECLPIIDTMVVRAKEIEKKIHSARSN